MKNIFNILVFLILSPTLALATTTVLEGDAGKAAYEANKSSAQVLAQKDKKFILRMPDGTEKKKPKTMTVKVGEQFFITNEEERFVHNVYDNSDNSWVLKKQQPSEAAAITFNEAGTHKLRCAIHPKMKVKIIVE